MIGLGIGALFGGTFAGISSYREGNRGITLIGDILGGALVGGALGAAGAIGGLFGAGMIGLKATGIALGLSTIGSFGVGVGAYALEQTWGRGIEWNTTDAMISGVVLALESFIHFTIGAAFSAGGLWRSLNKGQIKQMYSALYGLGLSKTASAMGALTMYFSENAMQMALRFGIKYLYTYPWKFIRENLNASY